jgi:DNA-binding Xre family transcriptional regulator
MNAYQKIDNILRERGMSRRKLALESGIPPSTFQSMMERQRGLTIESVYKISCTLKMQPKDLI